MRLCRILLIAVLVLIMFELPKDDIGNSDSFATIPDVSLDAIASRVIPRDVQTGVSRGTEQILVDNTGLPKVLSGNQKTFGLGFYVAKTGKNVTTITDPADLAFNSNQNTLKVVYVGTTSLGSIANGVINSTFADTGYKTTVMPAYLAYIYDGSTATQIPHVDISGAAPTILYTSFVSTLQLINGQVRFNFAIFNFSGGTIGTTNVKFYILQESAI